MTAAISNLPAGRRSATTNYDPIPGLAEDGIEVSAIVEVDPAVGTVTVDLTDNIDCLPCGINLSEACARTSALIGVFNSIEHTVPRNAGSFRRVDIRLRDGCIVGVPRHPTSTSAATTNLADRTVGAVQLALSQLGDGIGMAEFGPVIPSAGAVISGQDPRSGQTFVNQIFLMLTGGAATPHANGWLTAAHAGNNGMLFFDSIEVDELRYPILVRERRMAPDSEGAGRTTGAQSAHVEFGPITGCELHVIYGADGAVNPAQGARGGQAGSVCRHELRGSDGSVSVAPSGGELILRDGESVRCWTTSGGGYGDPRLRPVDEVLHDVAEGLITPDRAAAVYGVVVTAAGALDARATELARASA